jgi:hypothetical protein
MMIQCQCPSHRNLILLTQIQNQKRCHQKVQDPARMQTQTFQHVILQSHTLSLRHKQFSSRFGPLQNKDSTLWMMWNLLEKSVIISFYTKRQSSTGMYYSMDGDLVYCNNNQEVMKNCNLKTPLCNGDFFY